MKRSKQQQIAELSTKLNKFIECFASTNCKSNQDTHNCTNLGSSDTQEGGVLILTHNGHGRSKVKSPGPPSLPPISNTLFTSERSNMDYFTLAGVCKRTGATQDELAVFGLKENIDNALDFSEVNFQSSPNENPEIFVDIMYNKERNYLVMRVRNSSFGLKGIGFTKKRIHAIFDDLDRFHSSKRNLFKQSRGIQGDALKEQVGIPYALGSKYNGKEGWYEPLIIRNGIGEEFEIRAVVDKIGGRNYCSIVKKSTTVNDNFTEIETHLPYNDKIINLIDIKLALIKYSLLNTHITFHFNIVTSVTDNKYWNVTLPATQELSVSNTNSKRLTSIYWSDLATFENLLYGIEDKSLILYDLLTGHFKEGSLLKKEVDLLIPISQLLQLPRKQCQEKIIDIFLRLRRTMGPPTDPFILKRDLLPFSIRSREKALYARANQLGYRPRHIKYKAKTGHYYSDNHDYNFDISNSTTDICVPYLIETAVIHTFSLPYYLLYCEGTNAAANHYHSFTDRYHLKWTTKSGTTKQAHGINGLLKECGYSYGDGKPEKERSIVLVNLWCPKLYYTDYGKSDIDLNPFYYDFVDLLSRMCSASNKRRDDEGNNSEAKALFAKYLVDRYKKVLMEPYIKNSDSWNTSTPVYRYRPELERRGIHVERKYLQSLVKTIYDEMPELQLVNGQFIKTGKVGVKRETLGIYEAPGAFIYFRGQIYDVSYKQLEQIKELATFILVIEKEGVVELLTYWADKYGFALCYTKGFLTENAKEYSKLATRQGARMVILTDDDFSGWAMARELSNIPRIGIRIDTLEKLNIPISEVVEDLPKPKNSKGDKGYGDSRHATTAEQMYDDGLISEEDWKLLTGGNYGRRIEIDNVIAYVGAEKFWNEFILPSFQALFDTANYNLSRKKVTYVMLQNLNLLNMLAEKAGTIAAADEFEKIESEHADYNISTKGFIEDIEAGEKENTKRIENRELENKDILWLEKQLSSLKEEFSERTGITLTPEDSNFQ